MSIPKSVEKAALECDASGNYTTAEARARSVILALTEDLPESAVEAALDQYLGKNWRGRYQETNNGVRNEMRAAIAAFLNHVAVESP